VLAKMSRLADHIRYADAHGNLGEVDRYLRGLREEEWAHFADFGAERAQAPGSTEADVIVEPVPRVSESDVSDLDAARRVLNSWAKRKPFVRRLWTSDLDVAIEFDPSDDEDCLTTWACEGQGWQDELQASLPWRLQLEWYDPGGSTPRVAAGISDGSILIYERAS
jgi:hypothetical protein